jgi:hypothetical protein
VRCFMVSKGASAAVIGSGDRLEVAGTDVDQAPAFGDAHAAQGPLLPASGISNTTGPASWVLTDAAIT